MPALLSAHPGFRHLLEARRRAWAHLRTVVLSEPSGADRFRHCPVCGSSAVNAVSCADAGNATDRWSARCGQCQTRRTRVLAKWESRELICWYASDRACIEEALGRSRWTDLVRELGVPRA